MFHLLRLNIGICYFFGLIFLMVSQSRDTCADRHTNIAISALLEYFFIAAASFICAESFATFQAITAGVIGGKTWAFILTSYGFPVIAVGLNLFFYGDDYGTDPRCFMGWENQTKNCFFYFMLVLSGVIMCSKILYIYDTILHITQFGFQFFESHSLKNIIIVI